jgi:hypothetical protein
MPADLTPELALAYLGELSADVREGVVLDADGRLLAGSPALAGPARELMDATFASQIEVRLERGSVFAARSAGHAIAVVAGRFALPALMLHDLRVVLGDLAPDGAP